MNVIGDVKGKNAVLVDDMIDTAGTLLEGARLLKKEGANKIYACATHPVFFQALLFPVFPAMSSRK